MTTPGPSRAPTRARAAWAAVAAGGVLLAFAPAALGWRTLSHRDTDLLYAPVRTLAVAELRAGRLPLWNPYEGTGKPLFAEGIHSVLHPISLLGAALAPASVDFLLLAYLVAAALGAFVLAATLGASPAACAGAGLGFALSGYSASMTGNVVFLAGLSTLPWVLAAARRAGEGARWGPTQLALATACALFSGDVQVAAVGLVLGALLAADAGGARGLARTAGGAVAGALLAGVQLAATGALLPRTYRSLELGDAERILWPLEPGRLLEWIVPGLFRGPLREVPIAPGTPLEKLVFAESVYLGAPLLLAAAVGAARAPRAPGGRRTVGLLGAAAVALLWLALGHHLGARQLLDAVPVWGRFRYSEKLMAPLSLCLCALAALGADAFGAAPLSRAWRRALAGLGLVAGGALAALLLAPAATGELAVTLLGTAGAHYRSTLAGGLPHLVAALAALLAADRLGGPSGRTIALSLLVAAAPALAASYGAPLGSREVRRFETSLRLAGEPVPRLVHPMELLHDPRDPLGAVDAAARNETRVLGAAVAVALRVDTIRSYGAFEPRRLETLHRTFEEAWVRVCRRFAVTHAVTQAIPHAGVLVPMVSAAVEGGALAQRDEAHRVEVWSVPHRPWAFFAEAAVAVPGPLEARKALVELVERSDDATVVVEAPDPPPTSPGRVLAVERGTRTVRLEAEAAGPALLVVQDAWWPGWRATIDGRPAELLAADFLVRAIRWPPGRHRVELTYDPPELRTGLALSGLGAALVLLLAVRAVTGSRRAPTAAPDDTRPPAPGAS